MPENTVSVGLEIKNPEVREELKEIISSLNGFRVPGWHNPKDCDIFVLEIGSDLEKEFRFIQSLQDAGTVKDIFLTSSNTESEVLIRALRAGAREFFPQPLKREEIINAFVKFNERAACPPAYNKTKRNGRIINVIGSKGGIGTTTIAVNIARSLIDSKKDACSSVVLIDLNLLFGEIPLFLDIKPVFSWAEVMKNITRLDSTYLMSVLSKHPSGMYVLPSPGGLDGANLASADIIEKILRIMKQNFDYIVIDSGQSLDETSLKVLELSDTVLVNSILSLPCLSNVKRLLETFMRLGYPLDERVKVIINRYHKNSVISLKEAEKGLGKKIFWSIPNDYQTTISAINQGKSLADLAGKSQIAQNIREMAAEFAAGGERKNIKGGVLGLKFMQAAT